MLKSDRSLYDIPKAVFVKYVCGSLKSIIDHTVVWTYLKTEHIFRSLSHLKCSSSSLLHHQLLFGENPRMIRWLNEYECVVINVACKLLFKIRML